MIPLDKLESITHVIAHGPSCPDGIASALIIKDALPDVRVSFMQPDSAEHKALVPELGMLFVDFSPYILLYGETRKDGTRDAYHNNLWAWRAVGAIVLDHHPTRRDVVESFGENGVFGENEKNECGAWLAYTEVWFPLYIANRTDSNGAIRNPDGAAGFVEDFATLAAIRDTWKKDDPRWQQACEQAAELVFWGYEHRSQAIKSGGIPGWAVRDERLGRHLLDKQLAAARVSLDEAHRVITSKGTDVCVFQGVSTTSDAAELAEKEVEKTLHHQVGPSQPDLVVGFHYWVDAGELQLQFSMRSHTGYDVGAFAKSRGGGGHKAAAGFMVEISSELSANPYQMFRLLLEEWEGR